MQANAVTEALEALRPYDYGWRCEVLSSVRFLGHPVSLEVETRPFPAEDSPPAPSRREADLASHILASIPEVLVVAERLYAAYNVDFPDVLAKVNRPRVWICREFQERDGPNRWAFVVGISDPPNWSIFVEFRGLEFLEIWSGD